MIITTAHLQQALALAPEHLPNHITPALEKVGDSPIELGWFLRHYADWNATFASGVTALTSLIGQHVDTFVDKTLPLGINDRSVLIASYIFDAARDEYNDGTQAHRDPHRTLAQATLIATAELTNNHNLLTSTTPSWLKGFRALTMNGYTGGGIGDAHSVFEGIGYHLGSELLADQEFSAIDAFMRERHNDLVQKLMRKTVELHGSQHRCYAWIGIHSGAGGGVEMDHLAAGLDAANTALQYLDTSILSKEDAVSSVLQGFRKFAAHQQKFFRFAVE